jgi:uncharacterized protein (TIGR03437 family)
VAPGTSRKVSIDATFSETITGTVEGNLALSSQNTGQTLTIPYWGNFLSPQVNAGGVVNAASQVFGPSRVAAGSLISVFGAQMTPGTTAGARATPLPTSLAGTRLLIDGLEAPLLYVSPNQINAQIPRELANRTSAAVQLIVNGLKSPSSLITLAPTGPGIFAINQAGSGTGAVLHSIGHGAVTATNPARRGEFLEVYVTGLGPTWPLVDSGEEAPHSPLAVIVSPLTAQLGGMTTPVHFAGLAPGFVGLYQVNIEVPSDAPSGEVPLVLISNGVSSNVVTVSIAP